MFFPTWSIMLVGIFTFQFGYMQFMKQVGEQSIYSRRYVMLACNFVLMLITIFYNRGNEWLSTGLFVVALLFALWAYMEYRRIPKKLPVEPGF